MLTPLPCRPGPALILGALLLIGFGRLVARPGNLIVDGERPGFDRAQPAGSRTVGNDLTRLFLPHHRRIAEAWRRTGQVPGWDTAGFGGRPLVGNPQAGLWYPPVWLAWWSGAPAALGWLTVAHLLGAGLGAYWLARSLGLRRGASLVAGGGFELSPYLMAQTYEGHCPHVWAACWYPWAFLAALVLRRGEPRGGLALPIVLALAFLTGHPQEAYYLTLALGAWAGYEALSRGSRGGWSRSAGVGVVVLAIALLTVGLLAIEWLPIAKAQAWGLKTARLSASRASRYSVGPWNLTQLLSPNALGGPADYVGEVNYWESLLAPGGVVLVLAVVGLVRSSRREGSRGWGTLVGVAVAFAMGRRLGLFTLMYEVVPGMDRFRVPGRSLFLAALGVALLAGLGVEVIARRPEGWERWWRLAIGLAVGLGGLLLAAGMMDGSRNAATRPVDELGRWLRVGANLAGDPFAWATLLVPVVAFGRLRRRPGNGPRVAAVLGTLALAELAAHAFVLIRVAPVDRFCGPDALAAAIDRVRPEKPFRVRARDAFLDDMKATAWGLEKTNLGDAFQIQHAADLYEWLYPIFDPPRPDELMDPIVTWQRKRRSQAVLDRMNVALLVTDRPEGGASWPVVAEGARGGRHFWIYRNPTAMPRAYVVPTVRRCRDDAGAVALLPWVDPRRAVLMEEDPLGRVETRSRQPFTTADYEVAGTDRVEVAVTTQAPGLLVVADTWMPGWSATRNGEPVRVWKGNRSQRVVALTEAGKHRIVMRYRPPGWDAARVISGVAALIWLAGVLFTTKAPGTRKSPNEEIDSVERSSCPW